MSKDNQAKRVSGKSVAGFLFMPQWRLMWPAFSHIIPIFVRTLALMLEQAELIQKNHPGTMYGADNVKKVRMRDLIGEAWYTLRTQNSKPSPYQWGLFISIVGLCVTIGSALLIAIVQIAGLGATVAHAQLFSHPSGGGTDLADVGTATPGGMLFDARPAGAGVFDGVTGNGAGTQDLAIMLLDKVLRQSAMGTGGPLQNALAPLLATYSSGVLVIASFIVFWAIVSVVIDTARTGQIGGGRHNMVWFPIRFIFAMGLMIPMGSGFSSGQLLVLKLAEWGSNLGSNGWVTYVQTAADQALLGGQDPELPAGTIMQYSQMWHCKAVFNSYLQKSTGGLDPDQVVLFVQRDPSIWNLYETETYEATNKTETSLCGAVEIPSPIDPKYVIGGGAATNVIQYLKDLAGSGEDTQLAAMNTYKLAMRQAHKDALFNNVGDPTVALGANGGTAHRLACDLARENEALKGAFPNGDCTAAIPVCPGANDATNGDGDYPDSTCISDMFTGYLADVTADYTAARVDLLAYITGPFIAQVENKGWAAMGVWYHKISQLNTGMYNDKESGITIKPAEIATYYNDETESGGFSLFNTNTWGTNEHYMVVGGSMADYKNWWEKMISETASGAGDIVTQNVGNPYSHASAGTMNFGAGSGGNWFMENINEYFAFDGLLLQLSDYSDTPTGSYPIADLARIGNYMVNVALGVYTLIGLATIAGTAWGSALPMGQTVFAIMSGPVGGVLGTLAGSLFLAGAVLLYYVPLLPWIRVAFAVMAWITSVFEAVVMIPIFCLAHLQTTGEGLAGAAEGGYKLLFSLLVRPILTVIGFVGALLIFNSMVLFLHDTLSATIASIIGGSQLGVIGQVIYAIIYVGVIYTFANSTFKLVDIIPAAVAKWYNAPRDAENFEDNGLEGMIVASSNTMSGIGSGATGGLRGMTSPKDRNAAKNKPKTGADEAK